MTAKAPTRERMLDATAELLQKCGYHGIGLAEILSASGAPRGSMYFHFPGGKEQLAVEALSASSQRWKARIDAVAQTKDDPGEALVRVCAFLADELELSGWELGCPIATVALEASSASDTLRAACAEHFAGWQATVVERLERVGITGETAVAAATFVLAAIEGALLLARVQRSRAPLDRVGPALRMHLDALRTEGRGRRPAARRRGAR